MRGVGRDEVFFRLSHVFFFPFEGHCVCDAKAFSSVPLFDPKAARTTRLTDQEESETQESRGASSKEEVVLIVSEKVHRGGREKGKTLGERR